MNYAQLWHTHFQRHFPELVILGPKQQIPTGLAIPVVIALRAFDTEAYWTPQRIEQRCGWAPGTVENIDRMLARNYPECVERC